MKTKLNNKYVKGFLIVLGIIAVIMLVIASYRIVESPYKYGTLAAPDTYKIRINEDKTALQVVFDMENGTYGHNEYYDVDTSRPYIVLTRRAWATVGRSITSYDDKELVFVPEDFDATVYDEICYNEKTHEVVLDTSNVTIYPKALVTVCTIVLICASIVVLMPIVLLLMALSSSSPRVL